MNRSNQRRKNIAFSVIHYLIPLAFGGFIGAITRYAFTLLFPNLISTILVNVIGSIFIGMVFYNTAFTKQSNPLLHHFLIVGFLASFTTYSTFALDTFISPEFAMLNVLLTYVLGFTGVLLGKSINEKSLKGAFKC
tara:strand:- start:18604 stop:19011 length:408 start_codon:yes stop_codon:yes gene_type:complete